MVSMILTQCLVIPICHCLRHVSKCVFNPQLKKTILLEIVLWKAKSHAQNAARPYSKKSY